MSDEDDMKEGFLENEDHSTEPEQSSEAVSVETKPKKSRRVASRFFNIFLGIGFFIMFVMSLVSFSASSNNYRKLAGSNDGAVGRACALNAKSSTEPGSDGACQFSIGGEVVLALYAALSVLVMVIKTVGGWSMLSCFLVFEIIAAFVMCLISFSASVVISVGLSLTCGRLSSGGTCTAATVYGETFYTDIEVAQATAWLGFAVLVFIFVFYIICLVMYCYGRRQAKKARDSGSNPI